jgi:hypothetical protein
MFVQLSPCRAMITLWLTPLSLTVLDVAAPPSELLPHAVVAVPSATMVTAAASSLELLRIDLSRFRLNMHSFGVLTE